MSNLDAIPSVHTASEPCITAGPMRVRASRERRRAGFRCYTVEMRETEITRLIELGYLSEQDRDDKDKVLVALYRFLDRSALGGAHR